jgi:hypothetical protein
MVGVLRELGPSLRVQLHLIKSPAWVPCPGWELSGTPQRSRESNYSLDSWTPGMSMHHWIVVPVKRGGKHKLGRYEVVVGQHIVDGIGVIQDRLSELSKAWRKGE